MANNKYESGEACIGADESTPLLRARHEIIDVAAALLVNVVPRSRRRT